MTLLCRLTAGALFILPIACGSDPATGNGSESKPKTTRGSVATNTEGFEAPPASAKRVVLTLDAFDVDSGAETYRCQNFENPFDHDVAILQTQSIMSSGSHHLAAFRIEQNADGALEECSGLEFHATIHAAQRPVSKTTFPEGVGAFLAGTEGIRLNAHYLNLTTDVVHASVKVALDYVDPDDVANTAAQIYLNDSKLDIPPGTGTGGGTMSLPVEVSNIKLVSAQSHMHRRAVHFSSTLEDGTMLYETDSWNEPPVKSFTPPLPLADGASITWKCEFQNETSEHLTFGESANTNEMCVFTAFYYPAPDGQMLVGDTSGGGVASLFR